MPLICSINSPEHKDLLFYRMKGHEELGRLFEYEVDLLSEKKNIPLNKVLGTTMQLELKVLAGERLRTFAGIVTQFRQLGAYQVDEFYLYRAIIRPKLWLLTRTLKSRIFENCSVENIISNVLQEYGIVLKSHLREELKKSKYEYCVQYRESDFDFVSRLMEQEGIYYFFKHSEKNEIKDILVLVDSMISHKTVSGYEGLHYQGGAGFDNSIHEWFCNYEITSSVYGLVDYDFIQTAELSGETNINKTSSTGKCNDYLVDYNDKNDKKQLKKYSEIRLEELQTGFNIIHGRSTASGMSAGMLFALLGHFDPEQNKEYTVISTDFVFLADSYRSDEPPFANIPFSNSAGPDADKVWKDRQAENGVFECCFTALPSTQQFRPRRITPMPFIQGSQTAFVAEECDKYGRVRVVFHWSDGKSCWVRVSHPMAGNKWGWISLPRVGQEVIVNFEEGNPNRPFITGRVYNGNNMPPYDLPANHSQSGIKTCTWDSGGAHFNELRFEDKQGSEEIFLHAEKDLKCVILNNETREITKDRKVTVKNGDDGLKVEQGKCTIEAMTSIELKVGQNTIKIDQQGITIKGMMVTIEGKTKLDAKSPMTTVNGDGILTLKGGLTMIN